MPADLTLVSPWFFVAVSLCLGAIAGSFVNAAIHRLPRGISLLTRTRSFCPSCEAQLAWYENVPIFSFLALAGRCGHCKTPIPRRYLLVELLVAGLFALAAYQFFVLNRSLAGGGLSRMPWILFAIQLFLLADLICITFTDLETWYIPAQTTLPWIPLALLLAPFFPELHGAATDWTTSANWNSLVDAFQGLVIGAGLLWAIGFGCLVLLGKQGMGGGDIHLLGLLGAVLGWKAALITILLSFFLGCVIGIPVILWSKFQRHRLGKDYQPRQARFEMTAEEAQEAQLPPPSWPLLAMGLGVVSVEGALFAYSLGLQERSWLEPCHLNGMLAMMLGLGLILAYPLHRRMVSAGNWGQGQLEEGEGGKKAEVIEGNYIPFGPALALAGLVVLFYDPWLRSLVFWWFLGTWFDPPYRLLFLN